MALKKPFGALGSGYYQHGAVLWDLDGTLVDSEEYHWLAWKEILDREGIALTRPQFLSSFAQRNDAILRAWLGADVSLESIRKIGHDKEAHYRELVRTQGLAPLPGAAEWVERLHLEGSSSHCFVGSALECRGSSGRSSSAKVVPGNHGGRGCPRGHADPQVFLVAASRLNSAPGNCIVVEDARAGVEGARREGMRSIEVGKNASSLGADLATMQLSDLPADSFSSLLATATRCHRPAKTVCRLPCGTS